jgi:hypothetical protein
MRSVTESIRIAAAPEVVYDLVADVAGMGRFSPEATGAVGAGRAPEVGHTFWGTNRRGPWFWMTRCRVTAADRGRAFAFDVDIGPFPVSSWSYEIEAEPDGCRVTETWVDRRTGLRGAAMRAGGSIVIPGPRDEHNRGTMRATLAALRDTAESA